MSDANHYTGAGLEPGSPEAQAVIERVRQELRSRGKGKSSIGLMTYGMKACPTCGETFTKRRKNQVYCCDSCRKMAERAARRQITKPCVICGRPYIPGNGTQKTCSPGCSLKLKQQTDAASRATHAPIPCDECGTVFTPRTKRARFCSDACRIRHGRQERTRQKQESPDEAYPPTPCVVCGTMFTPNRSTHCCCSTDCARKRWNRENREGMGKAGRARKVYPPRACDGCGKTFTPKTSLNRFCCASCRSRGSSREQYDRKHQGRPVDPLRPTTCIRCGAEFAPMRPWQVYCSAECRERTKWEGACRKRREQRRAQLVPIPCPQCGEMFTPASARQLFCSHTCVVRAHRARKQAA